jgi:magnesium transporter
MRDQASGSLDAYLYVINNRKDDVVKTLTVITTLFLPISLVACLFELNFFGPVSSLARWTSAAAFAVSLCVIVPTLLAVDLWIQRWDGCERERDDGGAPRLGHRHQRMVRG